MAQRQQFLNFDKPEFVDNFVYTPPFEMMDRALKVNQEGMNTAIATANLFHNLNIDYIDDEQQRQRVGELIKKYAGQADDIAALIRQDPSKWRQQGAALSGLKNQLAQDFQYGEIYRTQKNAENWKAFKTELEGIEDQTTRQALKEEAMQKWRASYGPEKEGGEGRWNTALYERTQAIDRPDMVGYLKEMDIKPDEIKLTTDLLSSSKRYDAKLNAVVGDFNKFTGKYGYIREVKESEKESYKKVQNAIDGYMQLPQTIAFEKQQERLRQAGLLDERYYDDEGNRLPIGESSWAGQAQMALQLGERSTEISDKWSSNETDLHWDGVAREEQELYSGLFGIEVAEEIAAQGFYLEKQNRILNGTTNPDGTRTPGLIEEIVKDDAELVKSYLAKTNINPIEALLELVNTGQLKTGDGSVLILKDKQNVSSATKEKLKHLEEEQRRNRIAGTAPLAEKYGARAALLMTEEYKTVSNEQPSSIPLKIAGGSQSFDINQMNDNTTMWEYASDKKTKVPRSGTPAFDTVTKRQVTVPKGLSTDARKRYLPILSGSYVPNSGLIMTTEDNKLIGIQRAEVVFGDGTDKNKITQTISGSTPYVGKAGRVFSGTTPTYTEGETESWRDNIDNNKVDEIRRRKKQELGKSTSAIQNSASIVASTIKGAYENGNFVSYKKAINDYKTAKSFVDRKDAGYTMSAINGAIRRAYRSWVKDYEYQENPQTLELFLNELERVTPGAKEAYNLYKDKYDKAFGYDAIKKNEMENAILRSDF